jgi:hypothetical protein
MIRLHLGGNTGGLNGGDLGNAEMDPMYEQLCNAGRGVVTLLNDIWRTGWTRDNVRGIVRLCNEVDGLIMIGEIAECSKTSKRGLSRIVSQHGGKLHARRGGRTVWQARASVAAARREVGVQVVDGGQDAEAMRGDCPRFGRASG